MQITCARKEKSVYMYVSGRGITPQNFACGVPKCEDPEEKLCQAKAAPAVISPMKTVDELGTGRSTLEVIARFTSPVDIQLRCTSFGKGKKPFNLVLSVMFSSHYAMGPLMVDRFNEKNNNENEQYNAGYTPTCRNAKLRSVFGTDHGCQQIPEAYDPSKFPIVRYVCPTHQAHSMTVNPVVADAAAKVEFGGAIIRNMKHVVANDKSHGGSHFGGVDFYYPVQDLSIPADYEAGVKSFFVSTFCELDSRQYSVIMQNGWDLVPEITGLKVSQGEDCKLNPKFSPNVTEYSVLS